MPRYQVVRLKTDVCLAEKDDVVAAMQLSRNHPDTVVFRINDDETRTQLTVIPRSNARPPRT